MARLEASKANAEGKCAETAPRGAIIRRRRRARRRAPPPPSPATAVSTSSRRSACVRRLSFHGDVIADGSKKLEEYRAHRSRREENFVEELRAARTREPERGGLTCWELCRRTYGASVPWLVLHHACAPITRQHLAKLVEEGRVVEERGAGLARFWRAASTPSEEEMKDEAQEGERRGEARVKKMMTVSRRRIDESNSPVRKIQTILICFATTQLCACL